MVFECKPICSIVLYNICMPQYVTYMSALVFAICICAVLCNLVWYTMRYYIQKCIESLYMHISGALFLSEYILKHIPYVSA